MRIKSKSVNLALYSSHEAAAPRPGEHKDAATGSTAALAPYRLVPALDGGAACLPAVLVDSNGKEQQPPKADPLHQPQPITMQPAPPVLPAGLLSRQHSATCLAENSAAQQAEPLQPQASIASGRPVRKRKVPSYAEDMIPSDVLARRKPPKGAAGTLSLPPPPLHLHQPAAQPTLPVTAPLATVAGLPATSGAAGSLPAAIHLVTVPAPGGGTMTGLAVPAAALLAMPALLQHHQQLLRAQTMGPSVQQGVAGAVAMPLLAPMPYRLLPVVPPAPSSTHPAMPAVREAAPRDIVQLAKQLDEEERKKALAASDARVLLRVVPASQAVSKGPTGSTPDMGHPAGGKGSGRAISKGSVAGRGRGRGGGRWPNKQSTDQAEQLALPPGTWHPGFAVFGGMTHVSVVQAAAAPPLPTVVVGTPPRCSQPLSLDPQAEYAFSEDPLRSTLEFVHHAARTAGRVPHYSGANQTVVSAEQRLYKERLSRAHYARDGRRFVKDRVMGPTRKSVRMRVTPQVVKAPPPPATGTQQQRGSGSGRGTRPARQLARPEDATDVRRGAEFQAQLPAMHRRRDEPTEEEAQWIKRLACRAGDAAPLRYDPQRGAAMPTATVQERATWVSGAHTALCDALGEERCAALGLLAMGADACAGLLSGDEESALEAGMREFGRAFHTIQLEQVPNRSVFDLQNYYYNVWKNRATPRSRAWYEEKAFEEAARRAELERLERAAVAEQEAQRQRQEGRYKRRMLREVVQWVRGAAHAPAEVHYRPIVLQRAQRAAKLIGSLNAGCRQ